MKGPICKSYEEAVQKAKSRQAADPGKYPTLYIVTENSIINGVMTSRYSYQTSDELWEGSRWCSVGTVVDEFAPLAKGGRRSGRGH